MPCPTASHTARPRNAIFNGRLRRAALCTALACILGSSASAQVPPADATTQRSTGSSASTSGSSSRAVVQTSPGTVFLYDASGSVTLQRGEQTVAVERNLTLDAAQPLRVSLGQNGKVALALSNGVGVWAKGPGSFSIRRFEQVPFQGNSRQNPYEPTSSTLEIELDRGVFAFAERQLSALSAMRLYFGNGYTLDAHETASFLVEVGEGPQGNQDRISVLNGRALLHNNNQRGSAILIGSGQFLQRERSLSTQAQQLRLPEQLTTVQQEQDAQSAHHAQMVNDRVWFVRQTGSDSVQAQVVLPVNFWLGKPHAATRIR